MYGWVDVWIDGLLDGLNGWMNGTNECMDGRVDEWITG